MTCSVPCRRCRDAAGSTPSSVPPTGCSNTVSISTRPTRPGDGRRMAARCGSNRPHHASPPKPCSPRRNTSSPGRSTPRAEPPAPSTTVERRRARRAAGGGGGRRSPATIGSFSSSVRPVPARPACSPPPSPTSTSTAGGVRGGADGEGGPRAASVTPGCARTPSPSCSTSGSVPTGHHSPSSNCAPARRSSSTRPACSRHLRCTSSSHSAEAQPVAARPRRRPPPAASRRPWRPVRRTVRQRPSRRARTAAPLHPRLGSRRIAAVAIRRSPRPRRLRSPRPDHPRQPRRPPRTDGHDVDRAPPARRNGRPRRLDERPRRRHQPLPCKQPDSTPDTSTANVAAPIAGGEHVHVGDVVATRRNDRTLITSAGEPVRNRETWTVTAIGTGRFVDREP